jgi:hypothetical protein
LKANGFFDFGPSYWTVFIFGNTSGIKILSKLARRSLRTHRPPFKA